MSKRARKPKFDLKTVEDVFDALGGTVGFVALTGRSPQAISNWKAEGRIAASLYWIMSGELLKRGYSADPRLWNQQVDTGAAA